MLLHFNDRSRTPQSVFPFALPRQSARGAVISFGGFMPDYFSHDYGARHDPKLIKLRMGMGQEGKGIFWDLIELMYEQSGYLLHSQYEVYADEMRTHPDKIKAVVENFDLFESDSIGFWNESVKRRLHLRGEKSLKAAKSAEIRWNNANALHHKCERTQDLCEGNAIKESKVKEIKDIVGYLNSKCKTSFRETSTNTKKHINARLEEKYTFEDFKMVIDFKTKEWLSDERMKQYLRPDTLFGTKFESYLNAAKITPTIPVRKIQ